MSHSLYRHGVLMVAVLTTLALGATGCSSSDNTTAQSGQSGSNANKLGPNLNDCSDPGQVTKKINGTYRIGFSLPLSGPQAAIGQFLREGYQARIDAANKSGELNGIEIKVDYKDDAYTPDRAKTNVTYFLQSEHVDQLMTIGIGQISSVADDQNAACVPLIFAGSAAVEFNNVSAYPWTVQWNASVDDEARYDVGVLKQKFPKGAKVGIAQNPVATGVAEEAAFRKAAQGSNITVAKVADLTDANAAATSLKAADVDAVYIAGSTSDCAPVGVAMARIGFKPAAVVMPSSCTDTTAFVAAGSAMNNFILPSVYKAPSDPTASNDPGVKKYLSDVSGDNKFNAVVVSVWALADTTINTLKQAANSSSGLTRQSVIQAARDQDYASPMMRTGIKFVSRSDKREGFTAYQTLVWDSAKATFREDGGPVSVVD